MLFRRCLVFAATTCIAFSVARPFPEINRESPKALRELSDTDLVVAPRALTHAQVSHHANEILKHQSIKNTLGKDKRKAVSKANTKAWEKEKLERKKKESAAGGKEPKKDKKEDAKDKARFINKLRKDKKAAKATKWVDDAKMAKQAKHARKVVKAAWWKANGNKPKEQREPIPEAAKFKPKSKPGLPVRPKFRWADKADRKQVSDALGAAAERMKKTVDLQNVKEPGNTPPKRGDTFKVSKSEAPYTGVQVRKAIMNSYLNQNIPVGSQKMPKPFSNFHYANTHPETALHNKSPIPDAHPNLMEYPITPNGWTGHTKVGPARVITSSAGVPGAHTDSFFGVIGHDANRGGTHDDHYLAHYTAAAPK